MRVVVQLDPAAQPAGGQRAIFGVSAFDRYRQTLPGTEQGIRRSDRDRCLDGWMRVVDLGLEVLASVIKDRGRPALDHQPRAGPRVPRQLQRYLLVVVAVDVAVAAGPDEVAHSGSHCCASMCVSSA